MGYCTDDDEEFRRFAELSSKIQQESGREEVGRS
jgi:hypothetical protein